MLVASIPSPPAGVFHLGAVPIRGYALCILAGIVAAVIITDRRMRPYGVPPGVAADIATWAVPFGLVGARLYHLATSPQLYWGSHGQGTVAALEIWHGGLGIWGGVLGGALGAWIGARRAHLDFSMLAGAVAPGLAVAQALGRWGNYFNQELYGRAVSSSLPWSLHITHPSDGGVPGYYQPTFLYESIWDLGVAGFTIWAQRRWRLGGAQTFAVYVMAYTAGRAWVEYLRIDTGDPHPLGVRLNDWTCLVVFVGALILFLVRRRKPAATTDGPPEEQPVEDGRAPTAARTLER